MFTGDLGRKLHRHKVLALYKFLSDQLTRVFKNTTRGLFVRITVPDRLTCSPAQLAGIANALSAGLLVGDQNTKGPECEVEVRDFAIAKSPFDVDRPQDVDREALNHFARATFGRSNKEMMIFFSPSKRALIALVESAKPDQVLKGVARQLRDKAKQFTETRPGIITVQFQDLTDDQLEDIAKYESPTRLGASSLQIVTHDFLDSAKRSHIHTVVYRSHSRMKAERNIIRGDGPAYFIRNPHNLHYADERCNVFGEAT